MRFNPKLKKQVKKLQVYVVLVEGKIGISTFKKLGYEKVYSIHQTSVPLKERLQGIAGELTKKDKVCILTDFDKRGKQMYTKVKSILEELGVKTDSTLRGILLKSGVKHIEEIEKFSEKLEG